MAQPKLGFNLKLRHFNAKAKGMVKDSFKNKPFETIGLITSVVGMITSIVAIGFSITANSISKSALDLAKSDTTQTAQIARLNSDIIENQKQNATLSKQLEKLISISNDTKEINSSTYKLLSSSDTISKLTNRQLLLNLKAEKKALMNDKIAKESDLFALRIILDDIMAGSMIQGIIMIDLPKGVGIKTLEKVKVLMGNGLNNKIFQTDKKIKHDWYTYLLIVSKEITDIQILNVAIKTKADMDKLTAMQEEIKLSYFGFINQMLPSLKKKEEDFKKKNGNNFYMVVPRK